MLSDLPDSASMADGLSGRNNSLPGYNSRMSVVSEPASSNQSTNTGTPSAPSSKDSGILAIIAGQSPGSKYISPSQCCVKYTVSVNKITHRSSV